MAHSFGELGLVLGEYFLERFADDLLCLGEVLREQRGHFGLPLRGVWGASPPRKTRLPEATYRSARVGAVWLIFLQKIFHSVCQLLNRVVPVPSEPVICVLKATAH